MISVVNFFLFLPTHYFLTLYYYRINSFLSLSYSSSIQSYLLISSRLDPLESQRPPLTPVYSSVLFGCAAVSKNGVKNTQKGKKHTHTGPHNNNITQYSILSPFFDCFRLLSLSLSLSFGLSFIYPSIIHSPPKKEEKNLFGIFCICIFFTSCISTLAACFGNRL